MSEINISTEVNNHLSKINGAVNELQILEDSVKRLEKMGLVVEVKIEFGKLLD